MTHVERVIANRQKSLYEYAQSRHADIEKFSDDFMSSRFCNKNIDPPYSVDQFNDIEDWIDFMAPECVIKPDLLQINEVPASIAGWLGFTYRHIHFVTGLPSIEIAKKVPVDKLILSYPGLHTIDEDMAIDIIRENFKL